MENHKILVVDDDDHLRLVLQETLKSCGYQVLVAASGNEAVKILDREKVDLLITDLMMPGIKGVELVGLAKEKQPQIGAIVITAYGTIGRAVESMQKGAFDFITKPFSINQIESRVKRFFEFQNLQKENIVLKKKLEKYHIDHKIVGQSASIKEVLEYIDIAANSDATVFIRGESGTGKELVAQAIHDRSDRAEKPFRKINCAAVPETLFESTLFGHEKGAFSGAYRQQKGIFEECHEGTILLDEISEIPYALQAKLLRVLQEMKITRVGSTEEISIDVRVIATTNRDIDELINSGKFREDLFFRLNVFPITLPPLRERKEDIPLIIDHFLTIYKDKYKFKSKKIAPSLMEKIMDYAWPGNIRQLKHMLERAILFSGKEELITEKHFKFEEEGNRSNNQGKNGSLDVMPLAEMERKLIFAALKKTNNHKTKAAELLGITVRTLRNKLNEYKEQGIEEVS
ncbi:MAG: sigma-54-dependent Fis family transcriptional regulator [Caldisericaceae bacterium]|nr:sigma-54-dependent Fis family transcriptional regulator [Caldisericaceae bacterium]